MDKNKRNKIINIILDVVNYLLTWSLIESALRKINKRK